MPNVTVSTRPRVIVVGTGAKIIQAGGRGLQGPIGPAGDITIDQFGGNSALTASDANDAAFAAADAFWLETGRGVRIPKGVYRTSTPPTGEYFGSGNIKYPFELPLRLAQVPAFVNAVGQANPDPDEGDQDIGRQMNLNVGQRRPLLNNGARANTTFGDGAGTRLGPDAQRNTFLGMECGEYNVSGYGNTGVGGSCMARMTYGDRNDISGTNGAKWAGSADPVADGHDFFKPPWGANSPDGFQGMLDENPLCRDEIVGPPEGPSLVVCTTDTDFQRNTGNGRDGGIHFNKGTFNCWHGYRALRNGWDAHENCAYGWESIGNGLKAYRCVGVGPHTLYSNQKGQYNVGVAHNALRNNVFCDFNIAIGGYAAAAFHGGSTVEATAKAQGEGITISGWSAFREGLEGRYIAAYGWRSMGYGLNTGNFNTAFGPEGLGYNTTGADNCADGYQALANNITGDENTGCGRGALSLKQDGTQQTDFDNTASLGFQARVSASHQVQLGDSRTTAYAYGAVQDRSDERDKTDIADTNLGLDFLLGVRPVVFRWDYRDDYVGEFGQPPERPRRPEFEFPHTPDEPDEWNPIPIDPMWPAERRAAVMQHNLAMEAAHARDLERFEREVAEYDRKVAELQVDRDARLPAFERDMAAWQTAYDAWAANRQTWWSGASRDGSKKRKRLHQGVIAQELLAHCEALGIDFAGLQHHARGDGLDQYTVGYQEFVPVLIKAVQQLAARVAELEAAQ